ncbi:hypothetical protein N0V86_001765 [Didymella sp. IMI 355093]|nr:hypothetical protein N0V86_001765 [Didymella sp. IMI 355093]
MQRLLRLCGTYSTSPRISALKEVVDLAYELRCADWRRFDKTSFSKTLKAVFMLGRLRAAYECFKTTALSFPEFGSLEWRLIESPHKVDIDVTRFCKQVQNLAKIIGQSSVGLSVAAVLIQIHRYVLEALSADFVELQPAIAESSAGMSENVLFSGTIPSKLKLEYLARERSAAASTPVVELDEDDHTFGPKVKTVQVFRIPADGSEPRLVHIAFHAQRLESKRKVPEFGFYLVPDFREFWASYHLDRKFARCTVENQPIEEIEGNYWVYRNGNPDLPENAYIKRMLGIDRVDHSRQFYYGDVFIVRFTEHSKTFAYTVDNIPSASSPSLIAVLKVLFQHEWESAFIESELRDDQYFEEQELKLETDKKILYQRMTPIERELLKRMPPNTLEILAIQSCDDDALVGASVGQSDDPDMVTIKTMRRPRALDLMGWSGFQSSQL